MMRFFIVLMLVYVVSYLGYRLANTEVWQADGQAYVIFPENGAVLYYAFRPLSYLDGTLTGTGTHIGPHQ